MQLRLQKGRARKADLINEMRVENPITQEEAKEDMDLDKEEQYVFGQLQPESQVLFRANAADIEAMVEEVAKLALQQLQMDMKKKNIK